MRALWLGTFPRYFVFHVFFIFRTAKDWVYYEGERGS